MTEVINRLANVSRDLIQELGREPSAAEIALAMGLVTEWFEAELAIDAGTLQVGDTVLAMPSGETSIIKGVETESGPVEWAVAGQIVTLHLSDIDAVHLRLGDIICDPSNPIATIKTFTAKILAFEDVFPMSVDVFRGRMNAPAKVVKLVATVSKGTGQVEKKRPKIVQPGALAKVVVELEREMPLELGTRVVLRANGETVAAGVLESVA